MKDRQYNENMFGGGQTIQREAVWCRTDNTMRSCLLEDRQYGTQNIKMHNRTAQKKLKK
jgi:hypothetical protein